MKEEEVAGKAVRPLLMTLGFPETMISDYGRVPIQVGPFEYKYADFVCYVGQLGQRRPYLVVEVKTSDELDASQPEFYARMLNCPFFAITNGTEYHWYLTGRATGRSIELKALPMPMTMIKPIPEPRTVVDDSTIQLIQAFETSLENDYRLLDDTRWHDVCTDEIRKTIEGVDIINAHTDQLVDVYILLQTDWMMGKPPNIQITKKEILLKPDILRDALISLYDDSMSIKERFEKLLVIKGIGPFQASQFLSSVDKHQYVIVEENVLKALRHLNLLPSLLRIQSFQDYMHVNTICVNLMSQFQNRFGFGLAIVHNFLWHYERSYRITGDWMSW